MPKKRGYSLLYGYEFECFICEYQNLSYIFIIKGTNHPLASLATDPLYEFHERSNVNLRANRRFGANELWFLLDSILDWSILCWISVTNFQLNNKKIGDGSNGFARRVSVSGKKTFYLSASPLIISTARPISRSIRNGVLSPHQIRSVIDQFKCQCDAV